MLLRALDWVFSYLQATPKSHGCADASSFNIAVLVQCLRRKVEYARDDRVYAVKELLIEHAKSPSLRRTRDPYDLDKLAHEIIRRPDRGNSPRRTWEGVREALPRPAAPCSVPIEDLHDHLHRMAGLAITDVARNCRRSTRKIAPPTQTKICNRAVWLSTRRNEARVTSNGHQIWDYFECRDTTAMAAE
jgi:hypothetical protein